MSGSRATSTVRRATPFLAAATVLAVLLGVTWVVNRSSSGEPAGTGGSGGKPPVLSLTDYQTPIGSGPAQDGWSRSGTLPDEPAEAALRVFGPASPDRVTALARSLGFTGPGREQDGVTTFVEPDESLRVLRLGQWSFSRGAELSTGTSSFATGPTRAVSPPVPRIPATSEDEALALARPVLEAAGLDASAARATGVVAGSPQVTVVADPEVDGLTSYGATTSVTVAAGVVVAAAGWAGDLEDGASYPLISARAAWRQLARTPMPQTLMACPEPRPEDADPLSCGGPVTVTGAQLALSLQHEGSTPLLVPAWLFEVAGSTRLLPVVAVDPSYLASAPLPTEGGGAPASDLPAQPAPGGAAPGGAAPGPASPDPVDPGSRLSAVLATESDDALVVTFTGGVDGCFDYRVVAQETGSSVRLSLVERPVPGKRACIEMAQIYQRRVPLTQPLGDRTVIDAETGSRVEIASP